MKMRDVFTCDPRGWYDEVTVDLYGAKKSDKCFNIWLDLEYGGGILATRQRYRDAGILTKEGKKMLKEYEEKEAFNGQN